MRTATAVCWAVVVGFRVVAASPLGPSGDVFDAAKRKIEEVTKTLHNDVLKALDVKNNELRLQGLTPSCTKEKLVFRRE